ncbi:hypothetical protein P280DRAFT_130322 [Massarina eburnea CBS 473.64]|uniref:Uncharacterized protein n=1 Tax=Massarina eburnea CBS 473.64 TaxID=1395130 RepID=A0A6A6SHB9_9PLEO|nr:hypothetical protein P280DRAFT_130322 [Massarina eburnea CBS 473.64]
MPSPAIKRRPGIGERSKTWSYCSSTTYSSNLDMSRTFSFSSTLSCSSSAVHLPLRCHPPFSPRRTKNVTVAIMPPNTGQKRARKERPGNK